MTRFRKSECKGTLFIRTGKTFRDIFFKKSQIFRNGDKTGRKQTLLYIIIIYRGDGYRVTGVGCQQRHNALQTTWTLELLHILKSPMSKKKTGIEKGTL